MKCHYCGAEVPENQKYCMYCGTEQMEDLEKDPNEQIPVRVIPVEVPAIPVKQTMPAPRIELPTKRGLGKMFFLGLLTLGIYPVVIWSRIVTELNIVASRYDGKRTMSYFGACMLAPVTLGIYAWVWMHNFCSRIDAELQRRGFIYNFGARTFWLWGVLGSLIIVGPFIFTHKLMKAMNLINGDFNIKG